LWWGVGGGGGGRAPAPPALATAASPRTPTAARVALPQVTPLQVADVVGMTVAGQQTLASHPAQPSLVAYTSGAVAVLYDPSAAAQTRFLRARNATKPLLCLAWSPDGTKVAAGEHGACPALLIFEASSGK